MIVNILSDLISHGELFFFSSLVESSVLSFNYVLIEILKSIYFARLFSRGSHFSPYWRS